jgi:CBS domain-containing protein
MSAQQVSAAVILDAAGQATGIITDWDLRQRVVAVGRDTSQPIREVMSAPLITLSADAPIYEAVHLMTTHHIHHLVLLAQSQPIGVVTGHDLVVLHSASPFFIAREIERQTSLAGLRTVFDQSQQAVPLLLRQGVRASQLGWLMADINDRLATRVLQLTEAVLGPPPVPYCWLVLGSEGRREQTFKTDQDNALIYGDPAPEAADSVRTYFLEFGRQAVSALIEAGFPPCTGHYTADNPHWTQSLTGWQQHFYYWATTWKTDEIPNFLIFFDFRGIFGDLTLAKSLHQSIARVLDKHIHFLTRLAHLSTNLPPPLGFWDHLIVEHNGEHRNEFDLKLRGTVPIVDLARFLALKHRLAEPNTLNRLEQLKDTGDLPPNLLHELAQSFEFLLNIRLQHQWQQFQAGQPLSNHINPKHLSALEHHLLQEAFKAIARAQGLLHKAYHVKAGWLF